MATVFAAVEAVESRHGHAMRQKRRRICHLTWRVAAYEGEYLAHGAELPLVAEVRGELTLEQNGPIPRCVAQHQLVAVVTALRADQVRQYPLPPFAPVGHHMTVFVDRLQSPDGMTSSAIARLAMTREQRSADGSLLARNQTRIDLEPVCIEQSDGVLDAFIRLLSPASQ